MAVFLYLLQGGRFAKTFLCIVALPKQLFYNTGIPACLWFLRREKTSHSKEILFIDATEMGFMKDRVHRDLAFYFFS
jgi:type I restriction-modification system DNA methylase subunit